MSAVQFNLLPDVKLEYNRAQRQKRLVNGISAIVVLVVLGIFLISFISVDILQKKLLDNANNDITTYSQKLKSIPDIEKILTVQNQLSSLPAMHQKKHISSRLFTYLQQVTPSKISIGKLDIDTTANTIEIVGTADTVESVNKFVDTLKFTNYTASPVNTDSGQNSSSGSNNAQPAFTNVILSKVNRDDKGANYTIDAGFAAALFDASQNVTLTVPQEVTTRSVLNAPSNVNPLFNGDTGTKKTGTQGGQ